MHRATLTGAVVVLAVLVAVAVPRLASGGHGWTPEELASIRNLWLGNLPPLPADPSNVYADDPAAAALGHAIFFDTRFSANEQVACATCHLPERNFTDGRPLAEGVGHVPRKSMTVVGTAYAPWFFWDGRKDSLWSQALAPFESPVEHGIDRGIVAQLMHRHYADEYEDVFGMLPDPAQADVTRVFVNVGKALDAYQRTIRPGVSRFDTYAEALLDGDASASELLDEDELAGLELFLGKGNCIDCHNGPLFTNNDFHNTGVPARPDLPADRGRALGARQVLEDEFNCTGPYSDADPADCAELRFLKLDDHALERAFKTPSLRNVSASAPYMHAGQLATLREVIEHYVTAPAAASGHSELVPLNLTSAEEAHLEAFLNALTAPVVDPVGFSEPPAPPSLDGDGRAMRE